MLWQISHNYLQKKVIGMRTILDILRFTSVCATAKTPTGTPRLYALSCSSSNCQNYELESVVFAVAHFKARYRTTSCKYQMW